MSNIEELEQYKSKFEENIQATNGCWFWLGSTDKSGRGRMRVGKKEKSAASLSWEYYNMREIPARMMTTNTCETLLCVKPEHIELRRRAGKYGSII